jgi:hypothetical protein
MTVRVRGVSLASSTGILQDFYRLFHNKKIGAVFLARSQPMIGSALKIRVVVLL